jgi:AcrR family transcriptional regulator
VDERALTRREQILQAALEVFSEKGFHQAKIEDIAQRAGIGKGTVYEYFAGKVQLFQEMLKEGMAGFSKDLNLELQKEDTVRGRLLTLARKSLEMGINHRPLARIALMETAIIGDDFRRWLLEMHNDRIRQIEEIIAEGIKKREIREVNIKVFARLFHGGIGALMSPMTEMSIAGNRINELTEEAVGYYLQGIACCPAEK